MNTFYKVLAVVSALFIYSCSGDTAQKDEQKVEVKNDKELEDLNEKIKKDPANADLYNARAKYFISRQNLKNAASDIDKALSLDTTKADYYLTMSDVFFASNKSGDSKKALEKCVQLEPNNIDCLLKLGELYLYVQKHETSIEYLNKVLKIDVNNSKAYFLKGMNFKEVGDTNKAISSMQTAVEQDPDYYHAYIQLGLLMGARGNKLAIDYYNNALNINPRSIEANYNKAMFYQQTGDLEKAKESYNIILQIDSNYAYAHYNLGYIEFEFNKNYPAALKHFERAYKSDPNYTNALYMRGLCWERLGDMKQAERDYIQVMQLDAEHESASEGIKRIRNQI